MSFLAQHPERARLLAVVAILFLVASVRLWRLEADFPSSSIGQQGGCVFADEGWYCAGALNSLTTGHWYREGDLNCGVISPVWLMLQYLPLRILGIGFWTVRFTTFLLFLLLVAACSDWVRRSVGWPSALAVAAALVADHHLFAYSRTALLELPMTALGAAAMALACLQPSARHARAVAVGVGVVLAMALLVKPSAVFAPPLVLLILATGRGSWRAKAVAAALAFGTLALLLAVYLPVALAVGKSDFQAFTAVHYAPRAKVSLSPVYLSLHLYETLKTTFRMAPYSWCLGMAGTGVLVWPRSKKVGVETKDTQACQDGRQLAVVQAAWVLLVAALLATALYRPLRYYVPLYVPQCILAGTGAVALAGLLPLRWHAWAAAALLAPVLLIGFQGCAHDLRNARFTLRDAALDIARRARAETPAGTQPLIMGNEAPTVAMAAGVREMHDNGTTATYALRVERFQPSFFLWSGVEADEKQVAAMRAVRTLEPVATYPVLPDEKWPPMTLFRLRPLSAAPASDANIAKGQPATE